MDLFPGGRKRLSETISAISVISSACMYQYSHFSQKNQEESNPLSNIQGKCIPTMW
jgi:hypothetical protein